MYLVGCIRNISFIDFISGNIDITLTVVILLYGFQEFGVATFPETFKRFENIYQVYSCILYLLAVQVGRSSGTGCLSLHGSVYTRNVVEQLHLQI